MNDNIPKISVIIPVYNNAAYITDTLDSLRSQKLTEFEAIVIDDGSTDDTAEIVLEFTKRDDRITLLRTDHRGAAAARNSGLELASGEFTAFLDGDDILPKNAYSAMYDAVSYDDSDLCVGVYERLEGIRIHKNKRTSALALKNEVQPWDEDLVHSFEVWNKLYRTSVIRNNDIRFEDLVFLSDVIFTYTFLMNTDKIAVTGEIVYRYMRRLPIFVPVSSKEMNAHKIADAVRAQKRLEEITAAWPREFHEEMRYRITNAVYINTFYRHIWNLDDEAAKELTSRINSSMPDLSSDKYNKVLDKCVDLGIDNGFRDAREIVGDPLFTVFITGDVSAESVNDLLASLYAQNCPNFICVADSAVAFAVDAEYTDKMNISFGITRRLPSSPYVLYCDCDMMVDSDTLTETFRKLSDSGADMAILSAVDIDGASISGFDGCMGNKIIRASALAKVDFTFKWADARMLEEKLDHIRISDQAIILK